MLRNYLIAGIILAGFIGCESPAVRQDKAGRFSVSGKLTDGGSPLQVEGRDIGLGMVKIQFLELDESGSLIDEDSDLETTVDAEGKFNVPAGGLLPGNYRVAVYQFDPYPGNDVLKGKFDLHNSPIVQEFTDDTTLDIDLSKY